MKVDITGIEAQVITYAASVVMTLIGISLSWLFKRMADKYHMQFKLDLMYNLSNLVEEAVNFAANAGLRYVNQRAPTVKLDNNILSLAVDYVNKNGASLLSKSNLSPEDVQNMIVSHCVTRPDVITHFNPNLKGRDVLNDMQPVLQDIGTAAKNVNITVNPPAPSEPVSGSTLSVLHESNSVSTGKTL